MSKRIVICKECKIEQPHKAKGMCAKCYKKLYMRKRRKDNLEYFREMDRKRWPKRREDQNKKRLERYYANHEENKEKNRQYNQEHAEEIRKQQRSYSRSDHGKKVRKKYEQSPRGRGLRNERRKRYPLRIKAREAVNNAVKASKLAPIQTYLCECGKKASHYHHHQGYEQANWLKVEPLCAVCHARKHRD